MQTEIENTTGALMFSSTSGRKTNFQILEENKLNKKSIQKEKKRITSYEKYQKNKQNKH